MSEILNTEELVEYLSIKSQAEDLKSQMEDLEETFYPFIKERQKELGKFCCEASDEYSHKFTIDETPHLCESKSINFDGFSISKDKYVTCKFYDNQVEEYIDNPWHINETLIQAKERIFKHYEEAAIKSKEHTKKEKTKQYHKLQRELGFLVK